MRECCGTIVRSAAGSNPVPPNEPTSLNRLQSGAMRFLAFLLLFVELAPSVALAQAQNFASEVFLPAAAKGAIVVVVSGVSGPALYRDYCAKLAGLGYYTILVDGKDILIRPQNNRGEDGATNLRKIIADAQIAPQAVGGKVALVGFSLGGGGVLLHGAPLKDLVAAVVAYYPAITRMGSDMAPLASRMQVPVLLLAGGRDRFNNCCLVESMRALDSAAKAHQAVFELVVYPDAGHGFNLSVPAYRAKDANDAWARTMQLLRRLHPPHGQ